MLLGPMVLLLCDVLGRVLAGDGELQVGVMLGVVGAPFFIGLVRYGRLAELMTATSPRSPRSAPTSAADRRGRAPALARSSTPPWRAVVVRAACWSA